MFVVEKNNKPKRNKLQFRKPKKNATKAKKETKNQNKLEEHKETTRRRRASEGRPTKSESDDEYGTLSTVKNPKPRASNSLTWMETLTNPSPIFSNSHKYHRLGKEAHLPVASRERRLEYPSYRKAEKQGFVSSVQDEQTQGEREKGRRTTREWRNREARTEGGVKKFLFSFDFGSWFIRLYPSRRVARVCLIIVWMEGDGRAGNLKLRYVW